MKVVLDTNVLLAAYGTHGLCESVLTVCLETHELVLSEHILAELQSNLTSKFKMPLRQAREIVSFLRGAASMVGPAPIPARTCRDSDDLPVLGTAVAAQAIYLVTGDKDLLALGEYQGITILAPRDFYDHLRSDAL